MYLLYLDESGSHGAVPGNRAYVLAGLAVHEEDAVPLQHALSNAVRPFLPAHVDPDTLELHAAEMLRPHREHASPWRAVGGGHRRDALHAALGAIGRFEPADPQRPLVLFALLADPGGRDLTGRAYETVLNRFDDFLTGIGARGVAISDVGHDETAELLLQQRTEHWRRLAGPHGRLDRLCDVLFFSDSRASRLLQAADLVAWALWRRFGAAKPDRSWSDPLMERVRLVDLRNDEGPHAGPLGRSGERRRR